ncbi:MAG: hypothetical protein ACR2P0_07290, partial [Acidimicrobiales bacterium]
MTDTAYAPHDPASVRIAPDEPPPPGPSPAPGPKAVFVVLAAVTVGIGAALAFQTTDPDTSFVILGGTLVAAALLAVVGLYRYTWFLWSTLALRPALDDLIADEFGTFQPSAIMGIVVIGVTALHLVSLRVSGNWRPMTPVGWGFVGFFVFFVPSFLTSVDRGASQAAMFGLASVVVLYLAMEQQVLADRANFWKMVGAAAIGMIVPIIVGFVQFFWTGTLDPGGSGLVRIDGSFAHPNTFATYLSFAIVLAVSLLPTLDVRPRLALLVASILGGFLLVATFARGAWASFLLGMLLMASRINKRLVWLILGLAVGAIAWLGLRQANPWALLV